MSYEPGLKYLMDWAKQDPTRTDRLLDSLEYRRHITRVYFVRCEQYVKIGASLYPEQRLEQIRKCGGGSDFPCRLDIGAAELIATEPGGKPRERELHAKFSHLRHTGEWFTEAPELTEYIKSLSEAAA
jgi:hypothetical protein